MCKGLRAFFLINGENKIFFVTLPVVLPPRYYAGKSARGTERKQFLTLK